MATINKIILIGIIILVAFIGYWLTLPKTITIPEQLQGVLRPFDKPLVEFSLINQENKSFKLNNLKGKWSLVFFGYTNCPDICPTAMQDLTMIVKRLQAQHPDLMKTTQIVFVSVDPARDTPEHLKEYVAYFNQNFIALTGDKEQIDPFTRQLGAGYFIQPADNSGTYEVAHSGSFFLVTPDAGLHAQFQQPHKVDTIISQYVLIRQLSEAKKSLFSF